MIQKIFIICMLFLSCFLAKTTDISNSNNFIYEVSANMSEENLNWNLNKNTSDIKIETNKKDYRKIDDDFAAILIFTWVWLFMFLRFCKNYIIYAYNLEKYSFLLWLLYYVIMFWWLYMIFLSLKFLAIMFFLSIFFDKVNPYDKAYNEWTVSWYFSRYLKKK